MYRNAGTLLAATVAVALVLGAVGWDALALVVLLAFGTRFAIAMYWARRNPDRLR